MSDKLASDIGGYKLCMLDDTWVERQHADINRHYQRCPASKVPYVSACIRLDQNLAMVASLQAPALCFFHQCLRKHKAIGQLVPSKAASLHQVKLPNRIVCSRVYRTHGEGLRAWGKELQLTMAAAAPAGKRAAADLATRLQVVCVDVCVPEGRVLSLPVASDPAGTGVEQSTLGELRAQMRDRLCHEDSFFIIVDKWPARKKSVRTAGQQDFAGLRKPVAIQPLEWWPGDLIIPRICASAAPPPHH